MSNKPRLIAALMAGAAALVPGDDALAQSSPGLVFGQIPTAAQWNSYFAAKQDFLGFMPCSIGGCVMSGALITSPASAAGTGFNLPQGTSPSAPNNGDVWMLSTGLFIQAGGLTYGPITGSACQIFTPTTSGCVPLSGGGTSNFLRADGSWVPGTGGTGAGGGGSVASITFQCGLSSTNNPLAVTGTVGSIEAINAQVGGTYTFQGSDCAKLVTSTRTSPAAYSLPQATGATFGAGYYLDVANLGTGTGSLLTLTPVTSTLDGTTSFVLGPGQSMRIVSDGTNYKSARGYTAPQWVAATGSANAFAGNFPPPFGLVDGQLAFIRAVGPNTVVNPTFNANATGAVQIKRYGNKPIVAGDIPATSAEIILRYNKANNVWELMNPAVGAAPPFTTASASSGTLTATYTPATAALYDGLMLSFRAAANITIANPTFNPDSLGSGSITVNGGQTLNTGNIVTNGEYMIRYNGSRWELMNPTNTAASLCPQRSVTGTVTLTSADCAVFVTAGGGGATVNLPAATGRNPFMFIKKIDASNNGVTVGVTGCASAPCIDQALNVDLNTPMQALNLKDSASQWFKF